MFFHLKKITIYSQFLPPALFFQLIRFEYDSEKDLNVKVSEKFFERILKV